MAETLSTKLDRKPDLYVLYQICVFLDDQKIRIVAKGSDWLRNFQLFLWNRLQKFIRSMISTSSTKFLLFGPIGKTRWSPWPLTGWDIFDFSSETKLARKHDLNLIYKICVFRADPKNKMAAQASDWLRQVGLLSWNRWTEFKETWNKARSRRLPPSLCFPSQRNSKNRKNKMAAAASDRLRHFRHLFWNRWTQFNETWQEARSQCPLTSLCFSGRSEKQNGRRGIWLAETIWTSPQKTAERNSTKLDSKQDLNFLYNVCVFRADRKNKMAVPASDCLRHFGLLLWNGCTELN